MAKRRFFQSLLTGKDRKLNEGIYRRHILKRTGGKELRSGKHTVDDFVNACEPLLRSMQERGFDPAYPVLMGNNGIPRNGAHRLSLCGLLGIEPVIEVQPVAGREWGPGWFNRHDLIHVLETWVQVHKGNVFLMFEGAEYDPFGAEFEIEVDPDPFFTAIYGSPKPEKVRHLRSNRVRVVVSEESGDKKWDIRRRSPIDPALFVTCHASDSHEEAMHMMAVIRGLC